MLNARVARVACTSDTTVCTAVCVLRTRRGLPLEAVFVVIFETGIISAVVAQLTIRDE